MPLKPPCSPAAEGSRCLRAGTAHVRTPRRFYGAALVGHGHTSKGSEAGETSLRARLSVRQHPTALYLPSTGQPERRFSSASDRNPMWPWLVDPQAATAAHRGGTLRGEHRPRPPHRRRQMWLLWNCRGRRSYAPPDAGRLEAVGPHPPQAPRSGGTARRRSSRAPRAPAVCGLGGKIKR